MWCCAEWRAQGDANDAAALVHTGRDLRELHLKMDVVFLGWLVCRRRKLGVIKGGGVMGCRYTTRRTNQRPLFTMQRATLVDYRVRVVRVCNMKAGGRGKRDFANTAVCISVNHALSQGT